jgi:hypothetical protein
LKSFLDDAGADEILRDIAEMEDYRRALEATKFKEKEEWNQWLPDAAKRHIKDSALRDEDRQTPTYKQYIPDAALSIIRAAETTIK